VLLEGQKRNGDNFYAQRELALGLDQLFAGNSKNQEGNMSTGSGDLYKEANMGLVGRLGYDFKSKYWLSSVSVMTVLQNLQVDINGDSSHLYPEDGVSLKKVSGKIPNSISLII